MQNARLKRFGWSAAAIAACSFAVQGCGGGGASPGSGGGQSKVPTAVTKANTASSMAAMGQASFSLSFAGFGPNFNNHQGNAFQLPMLGLWDKLTIAPDGVHQALALDQAGTQSAGTIIYKAEDVGLTTAGTMTITAGRYSGLTGNYSQSVVTGGFSGNESYSIPNVATTTGELTLAQGQSGTVTGTERFAVALQGGYSQSEQIVVNADGSATFTGTDQNKYTNTLSFTASGSGTGTVKGPDPGLPATVKWDTTGTGTVTFADGSTEALSFWTMATL